MSNVYRDIASRAREIRDLQLATAKAHRRENLKATWDLRIAQLVDWQKTLTAVLEKAHEGRHGVPTSLVEARRIEALEAWISARCSEDAWDRVVATFPKPRDEDFTGRGWVRAWWLQPVFPPDCFR